MIVALTLGLSVGPVAVVGAQNVVVEAEKRRYSEADLDQTTPRWPNPYLSFLPSDARPDWHFIIDTDPAQSVASRRRVLESCCEHNHLVLPAHFPAPSVGRISAQGDAFRFGYERLEG